MKKASFSHESTSKFAIYITHTHTHTLSLSIAPQPHSPMQSPRRRSVDLEAGYAGDDGVTQEMAAFHGGCVVTESPNPFRRLRSAVLAITATRRFKISKKESEREEEVCGSHGHQATTRAAARLLSQSEEPVQVVGIEIPDEFGGIKLEEFVSSISRDDGLRILKLCDGVRGLSRLLLTDLDKGICGSHEDIQRRRDIFGSNTYPLSKEGNFCMFLGEASRGFTLIVLVFAAMASLLLQIKTKTINHGWYDEAGIIIAVILVIFVTAISNYNQSLQFEKLNDEKRNICIEVTRNGRRVKVSIYDVVVGDIIPLKSGDQVPADGVLVSGYSLQIGEYESMGTNRTVHKDTDVDPILISGSIVEDGIGTMLVTRVGMNTQWRMPMASIQLYTGKETPLQVYLNRVVTVFGLVSISVALIVFLIVSCLYFMGRTKKKDGSPMFDAGKTTLDEAIDMVIKFIILGVTIVVAAVPEGLPLAVTLNIAYMSRKLGGEKALVQNLCACEAMGSATTIVCHKTGILTLNQMEVVDVCAGRVRTQNLAELSPLLISLITEGISLNTNGSVYHPEEGSEDSEPEVFGTATECAILNFGVKLGMNFDEGKSKSTIFRVSPFNSRRKRRGVAVQLHDSQVRVHWKGAAKTILASCQGYMDMDNIASMDQEKISHFENTIDDMCNEGLRCAALAYRTYPEGDINRNEAFTNIPDSNLVLLAIIGIKDSCRPGIGDAIQQCYNAGIRVCMVTGDDLLTAKAIAMECGILTATSDINTTILASEFSSMSDAEREEIAENILVMGRSSPDENLLLLKELRKKGHVVAATGKGIRDAPSLRQADISLAMGIGGTSIVKECSDIIVLDDSFASILTVMQWGRSLYTNIQRFVQFRLTVSASALIICVVVAVHSHEIPLNVAQLLWVNLLIDTFGALALASEPPIDNLMRRPPVRKGAPFITKLMWAKFVLQVAYQVTALLLLNFHGESILKLENKSLDHAYKVKNTLVFNSFVFCQVFNEFECRTHDQTNIFSGILKNHLFLGTIIITVILQVIVIECLGIFISTVRLDWKQWLISIGIGFFSQVAGRFPFQAFPYLRN
ncbi:calcium-transporting ATPase 8, plasma membrane-type [Brassica rapa]|uniref:calcium-transporting ATPase 8, plasma membrane-type n=1 Tax=Brassica campestris TaxID=3711 RepID=UPI0004F1B809|nr:calcium-transporting ATPase 8, plasma membrane-type [Brassica rapa]XP_009139786.1 calcium-transporting ATPase 8, plasma membrane-type [Brassica rapa]